MPTVSIVIATYNAERYIQATIQSALDQTFADFEILVSDDGSSDRTIQIVEAFSDRRVRVVAKGPRLGPSGNFNRGSSFASGTFIKFLPHDDLLYPRCLEQQVAAFSEPSNSRVSMVSCWRELMDDKGRVFFRSQGRYRGSILGTQAIRDAVSLGRNCIGEPATVLVRRDVLSKTNGFRDGLPFVLDLRLWVQLLLLGDLFVVPEHLATFRVSSTALSYSLGARQTREYFDFIDEVKKIPECHVTTTDVICGKLNAVLRRVLRGLTYFWLSLRSS